MAPALPGAAAMPALLAWSTPCHAFVKSSMHSISVSSKRAVGEHQGQMGDPRSQACCAAQCRVCSMGIVTEHSNERLW